MSYPGIVGYVGHPLVCGICDQPGGNEYLEYVDQFGWCHSLCARGQLVLDDVDDASTLDRSE